MAEITLGSLFDGSGGFPLAAAMCGIRPVWASEVEPFPLRVTTRRLPKMAHLGDVAGIDGGKVEPVDIVTFGSPCQDLSLAGGRAGIHGSRSGLFYEAMRIVSEMREATDGRYPRFIVWENVTGAFSSNKGEDFHAVVQAIADLSEPGAPIPRPEKWARAGEVVGDGFSIAWRTLDAQHWGVPQRRRRIYLVADLAGGRAGAVLFESEGLPRDPSARELAEQVVAAPAGAGARMPGGEDGGVAAFFDVRLTSEGTRNARSNVYETDTSRTLDTSGNAPESNHGGVAVVYGIGGANSRGMLSDNPKAGIYEAATTRTIDTRGGNPACNQGGMVIIEGGGQRPSHRGGGCAESDVMYTLKADGKHAVAYGIDRAAYNQGRNASFSFSVEEELEPTMVSRGPNAVAHPAYSTSKSNHHAQADEGVAGTLCASDWKDPPCVCAEAEDYVVRRLTPLECCRLQGFPDWWCEGLGTDEPTDEDIAFWREVFLENARAAGKAARPRSDAQLRNWLRDPRSDAAEYKMWGNGVALPCVVYVLNGIKHAIDSDKALATPPVQSDV